MMIELTNPDGQKKFMSPKEYIELLPKYLKSKAFTEWSNRRNIAGMIKMGDEMKMSASAVEMFLRESGYKVKTINNW